MRLKHLHICISPSPPSLIRAVSSGGWLGERVPAFPAVRSRLEGFCLPTLPYIGFPHNLPTKGIVKVTSQDVLHILHLAHAKDNLIALGTGDYGVGLVNLINYYHERSHYDIFRTSFGQIIRQRDLFLKGLICILSSGYYIRYENTVMLPIDTIVVPLTLDPSGTLLQKHWHETLFTNELMLSWEEAIAVYSSLDQSYNDRLISSKEQRELERRLKRIYSKYIPGFDKAYDRIKKDYHGMGAQEIDPLVNSLLDEFSSSWREEIEREQKFLLKIGDQSRWLPAYYYGFPVDPLYCVFNEEGLNFLPEGKVLLYDSQHKALELPRSLETIPFIANTTRLLWIIYEPVIEQLTQWVGLQCPLWDGEKCCNFQKIWKWILNHTMLRKGSPGPWEPQGCLKL